MFTLETFRAFLGWTALLNYALLGVVFFAWLALRPTLHRLHRRWFALQPEQIDAILYALMGGFKMANLLLFVTPWLVLSLLH